MDYSSLPNDPGTSPWSAISPQQPSQSSSIGDLQSPDQPFSSAQSPFTGGFGDTEDRSGSIGDNDVAAAREQYHDGLRGGSQPYSSNHEYHHENSQPRAIEGQGEDRAEADRGQQKQTDPRQQAQPQSQQRQQQQPRQAQYKLQAKVTGLERTGRKDPILRFDVYVRFSSFPPYTSFSS